MRFGGEEVAHRPRDVIRSADGEAAARAACGGRGIE
jgi:hypothetical protein